MTRYITVKCADMPLTIPAIVSGYLALHRTLTGANDSIYDNTWTVTEIISGRRLCIINECWGARLAMRLLSTIDFSKLTKRDTEFIQTYTEAMYILMARGVTVINPTVTMIEELKHA